jgi:hypothetical protein
MKDDNNTEKDNTKRYLWIILTLFIISAMTTIINVYISSFWIATLIYAIVFYAAANIIDSIYS